LYKENRDLRVMFLIRELRGTALVLLL